LFSLVVVAAAAADNDDVDTGICLARDACGPAINVTWLIVTP